MSRPELPQTPAPGGRPLVMGIVNVTPDSFSDGGRWVERDAAIAHGRALVAAGADIVDIGGESTRPGAQGVTEPEELDRVLPVVETLAAEGVCVSVDTMRSTVAARCVQAGASIVNDVSGGLADPDMAATVAAGPARLIAMHWRGHSDRMRELAVYDDVVGQVCAELAMVRDAALAAGLPADRLVLDPGLGFAKDAGHNWALLAHLDRIAALGHPVLVGASRKRFLGTVGRAPDAAPREPRERDVATAVISALCAVDGMWAVRVHDVAATVDALDVVDALSAARAMTRADSETGATGGRR